MKPAVIVAALAVALAVAFGVVTSARSETVVDASMVTATEEQPDAGMAPGVDAGPSVPAVSDPEKDPGSFLQDMWKAGQSKNYKLLSMLLVVALTYALRRWGKKLVPWFGTDFGGMVLAVLVATGAGVANGLAVGAKFGMSWVIDIFVMAAGSIGAYVIAKKTGNLVTSKKPGAELLEPSD